MPDPLLEILNKIERQLTTGQPMPGDLPEHRHFSIVYNEILKLSPDDFEDDVAIDFLPTRETMQMFCLSGTSWSKETRLENVRKMQKIWVKRKPKPSIPTQQQSQSMHVTIAQPTPQHTSNIPEKKVSPWKIVSSLAAATIAIVAIFAYCYPKNSTQIIERIEAPKSDRFQRENGQILTGNESWIRFVPRYRRLSKNNLHPIEMGLQLLFFGKYPIPEATLKIYRTIPTKMGHTTLLAGTMIHEEPPRTISRLDNFLISERIQIDTTTPTALRIEIASHSGAQCQEIIIALNRNNDLTHAIRVWQEIIDVDETAKHASGAQAANILFRYKNISPGFPNELLEASNGFFLWADPQWQTSEALPPLVTEE